MAMVIRTAFNNQNWNGPCKNADRDHRLSKCRESVVDTGYGVTDTGQCASSECYEKSLCSNYTWYADKGRFGGRAIGRAYFIYTDVDKTLVLWGKSVIEAAEGNALTFEKFKALPRRKQVRGLTYKDLEGMGVPAWRSGTYRYVPDEAADALDSLILESRVTFVDPAEEFLDTEGRRLLRRHVTKERSVRLVKAFKAQLTDFSCSVCGFSFEPIYGELGIKFIEAHHTTPIAELTAQTKMTVSSLVNVCSNCHRMLHRRLNPPLSVEDLRKVLQKQ